MRAPRVRGPLLLAAVALSAVSRTGWSPAPVYRPCRACRFAIPRILPACGDPGPCNSGLALRQRCGEIASDAMICRSPSTRLPAPPASRGSRKRPPYVQRARLGGSTLVLTPSERLLRPPASFRCLAACWQMISSCEIAHRPSGLCDCCRDRAEIAPTYGYECWAEFSQEFFVLYSQRNARSPRIIYVVL